MIARRLDLAQRLASGGSPYLPAAVSRPGKGRTVRAVVGPGQERWL